MIKIAPATHLPPSSSESAFISGFSFGWSFNSNGTRDAFVFKPLQFSVQFQKFDLFTLPRFYSDIRKLRILQIQDIQIFYTANFNLCYA